MNNKTLNLYHHLAIKILILISISLCGFWLQKIFSTYFLFSLQFLKSSDLKNSISTLPLLLILPVILSEILKSIVKNACVVFSYMIIFLFLSPRMSVSIFIVLGLMALFYIEKWSREKRYGNFFVATVFLLSWTPVIFYSITIELSTTQIYFLILLKSCLIMRILSWLVDRRVYKRRDYDSFLEFLEFIFCPIFFIFPGQIQFFLFRYFHKNKIEYFEQPRTYSVFLLALWGLFLMLIYSYLDQVFWQNLNLIPTLSKKYGQIPTQLLIGLYWLILIYFQQTAGMAYQISLARLLGHNFKYDMHWPLLARSPLEYLRTHSSYVKDYIVDIGLRPLSLKMMRYGFSEKFTYPVTAIFSYSFFIGLQTGFRPDYERSWVVTLTMILFLAFFILSPMVFNKVKNKLFKLDGKYETLLINTEKPIKDWNFKDYTLWIINLMVLSAYKAFLGLARAFANRH